MWSIYPEASVYPTVISYCGIYSTTFVYVNPSLFTEIPGTPNISWGGWTTIVWIAFKANYLA